MTVISSNLGYPRLGEHREWKHLLEHYWRQQLTASEFHAQAKTLRLANLAKQQRLGVDLIPVGDNSDYDHVLDTLAAFGAVPTRFGHFDHALNLDNYYAIARGTKTAVAAEMTKWFNINYHYIVPEFDDVDFQLLDNRWLRYYQEAKTELGIDGKPVILGPVSFLKLGKRHGQYLDDVAVSELLPKLLPLYVQVFAELAQAGAKWVQIDEPTLVKTTDPAELAPYHHALIALHEAVPTLNIELQTYFDSLDLYDEIVTWPVQALGLDLVHDHGENLAHLQQSGFPADKILAAGIIDGHNVWASDLQQKFALVQQLQAIVGADRPLWLQPANSLLHVPITTNNETDADPVLLGGLAFADQKLQELHTLTTAANDGISAIQAEFDRNAANLAALNQSSHRNNQAVRAAEVQLPQQTFERQAPFATRIKLQHDRLHLPLLPTTTIGSFPQSKLVRAKRAAWRKGNLSDTDYQAFLHAETKRWIDLQNKLGLDVLVHGEFERTDMVEYFGQKLTGFYATQNGWVQSYGSRGVRPPVIFGDVAYTEPITVAESVYAQSLTAKPVKGMLTAPLTIINWSFVRDDIPKAQVQNQIALALRQEVQNLEQAGIKIIQVDEPALREGLPLKQRHWQAYLDEAVYSFKITTTGVKNDTQIHTHMCYSNFSDIIDTIKALDADVISIETSRSHGEIISAFEQNGYDKEIGLGVYDIHSPRVPSVAEIQANITRALRVIDARQFWINPDCGLKTRQEPETLAALKNMVAARDAVAQQLSTPAH
ncbi:5-methyltetrahydropteroyltriglutamate--homocysteine S-methyltransferase [Lactiplantibacillus fabifermentans]|uniref:5-methyltetrahydropteroyltriglutamate--homocysteine methyltransferase n=2 Tax=Lactiplantibacillus fabifermentans TaxID=483011 RepID=A0A0R2NM90_9LACO|nr:5-methyltetrahydropteroyltriglutamate--homocysteine S-methyltransferase [Lactiplantibacillus fabifermentans]ETY74054.1 5-methyltetrahydropteroyltriglutamate--homocysteine methyltransferase [Lactiplantibacillus fabifermentans T30PCM01]KRO26823.1 5-methyltetrahydropteroyltriglutamate--homocysteine S-methyltransferase [Lactiplantibacillus fabifermentans DSM 21115]